MPLGQLDGAGLVEDLDPLVEVRALAGEPVPRGPPGRIAGGAKRLRDRVRGGRELVRELVDAVRGRIGRREHGGYRDLRPRALRDGVREQRALGSEPRHGGRGVALVAVGLEVIAPKRVEQDEHDSAGPPRCRRRAAANRRSSPEADGSGRIRGHRELERDLPALESVERERQLPPIGSGSSRYARRGCRRRR